MRSDSHRQFELDHPIYDQLLYLIYEHRFATTRQLARFTRGEYSSARSALRQTTRHLKTLSEHYLVMPLERRVGGWQHGSAVSIWTLTTPGHARLTGRQTRKRPRPLSTHFLEHHLAVTEAHLIGTETVRSHRELAVNRVEFEPQCWRSYLGPHGERRTLKPDMFLQVTSPEYVDSYYLEIDMATENPARVIRKSMQYQAWKQRGTDQETLGAFPKVLWLAPHAKRQEQLGRHLKEDPAIHDDLFKVITLDDLPRVIALGPDQ